MDKRKEELLLAPAFKRNHLVNNSELHTDRQVTGNFNNYTPNLSSEI